MSYNLDWIPKEELEYLSSKKYEKDFPKLSNSLKEPRFTINDLGITPRDATYWSKKGILPDLKNSTGIRKYNLKQAIWIKLIQQLRSLKVSLSLIEKFKKNLLFPEITILELINNPQLQQVIELIAEQKGELIEYKKLIKNPEFLKSLDSERIDLFECTILQAIIFRNEIGFLIIESGECIPYLYEKHNQFIENIPDFESIMKVPHIIVSISTAYGALIEEWHTKNWFNDITLVTKNEQKILNLMRHPDCQEITIFKNNNEYDRIKLTKNEKPEAISQIAKHIARNSYQKLTVQIRNGKPVDFKNEYSLKLDNIPEDLDN